MYVRVNVLETFGLDTFSVVVGWMYFAAWTVSFYPQIYTNFRRRRYRSSLGWPLGLAEGPALIQRSVEAALNIDSHSGVVFYIGIVIIKNSFPARLCSLTI